MKNLKIGDLLKHFCGSKAICICIKKENALLLFLNDPTYPPDWWSVFNIKRDFENLNEEN